LKLISCWCSGSPGEAEGLGDGVGVGDGSGLSSEPEAVRTAWLPATWTPIVRTCPGTSPEMFNRASTPGPSKRSVTAPEEIPEMTKRPFWSVVAERPVFTTLTWKPAALAGELWLVDAAPAPVSTVPLMAAVVSEGDGPVRDPAFDPQAAVAITRLVVARKGRRVRRLRDIVDLRNK
jgi:hypothetical protein